MLTGYEMRKGAAILIRKLSKACLDPSPKIRALYFKESIQYFRMLIDEYETVREQYSDLSAKAAKLSVENIDLKEKIEAIEELLKTLHCDK